MPDVKLHINLETLNQGGYNLISIDFQSNVTYLADKPCAEEMQTRQKCKCKGCKLSLHGPIKVGHVIT